MINWSGGQWANPYINQYFYEACFSSWSNRGVSMVGMVKLGNDSGTTLSLSNGSFCYFCSSDLSKTMGF